jgi:hypothetical protein
MSPRPMDPKPKPPAAPRSAVSQYAYDQRPKPYAPQAPAGYPHPSGHGGNPVAPDYAKMADQMRRYGVDPWNSQSAMDMILNGFNAMNTNSGGGNGRGGGGGSAHPANPDPLGWNSIAQTQNVNDGYAAMLAALDQKAAADASGFDARNGMLTGARDDAATRVANLINQTQTQANAARGSVAGSYAQGDQRLAGLQNEYQNMIAARQAPAQATMSAFGANPGGVVSSPNDLQDSMMAARMALGQHGQADDALYANRANVYNGLNQDVTTANNQAFTGLLAKLAAEKQASSAGNAAARAQLAMQQQQQVLQLQAQEQARKAGYGG